MTNAKKRANIIKWVLFACWVICLVLGIVWFLLPFIANSDLAMGYAGTPAMITNLGIFVEVESFAPYIFFAALFFFTQWIFLCPRDLWKIRVADKPVKMKRRAIGAGFAAVLLTMGLFYSVLDLFKFDFEGISDMSDGVRGIQLLFFSIPAVVWVVWAVVFSIYFKRSGFVPVRKIIRGLIVGSILEMIVSVPIFVTSKEDCYCLRGSYAGIVLGVTVILWVFGPGVFLLFLREKRRREELQVNQDVS